MEKRGFKTFWNTYSTQISAAMAFLILSLVLSIASDNFLTANNLLSVLHQISYLAIMAVGVSFLITSGCIDLANSATLALAVSTMGELFINRGWGAFPAILVALCIGVLCGFMSSFFINKLNLLPFIVTLAAKNIYRGAGAVFTHGYAAVGVPSFVRFLGIGKIFGVIPVSVVIMLVVYVIAWFILSKTSLGMSIYAIGGNPVAAELSGIRIKRIKTITYMINGFLVVLAGLILAGRMNSTTPSMADGVEMDCIAAAVVGGTSMKGGEGVIWGTLIGSLIMGVLRNGLNLLGINSFWQQVSLGLVVLAAVSIDAIRNLKKS